MRLLALGVLKYCKLIGDVTDGVHPILSPALTAAHLASLVFRGVFLDDDVNIAQTPSVGYGIMKQKRQTSLEAVQYLKYRELKEGVAFQTNASAEGERYFDDIGGVDAFWIDKDGQARVIEYCGCMIHACMEPSCKNNCLSKKDQQHPFDLRLTYDDVYFSNYDRKRKLEDIGVKCELVFSCDARNEAKTDRTLARFMGVSSVATSPDAPNQPAVDFREYDEYGITPRAALRGGRVETVQPSLELTEDAIAAGIKRIVHLDAVRRGFWYYVCFFCVSDTHACVSVY